MHSIFRRYPKDFYGGVLMIAIGVAAIWQGLRYQVGTLQKMGPGFFPVSLGVLLALMGVMIAAGSKRAVSPGIGRRELQPESSFSYEWRGWICIASSIVAFIVLGKYGGLLPASFAIVFISALGDRENTLKSAFMLSLAIIVVCVVVFWWALQVQFPLFRWG